MAWGTADMIRQRTVPPGQQGIIQELSGVGRPPVGQFGSNIVMPSASPSSNAIANFANLTPQQPGAPAYGGGMPVPVGGQATVTPPPATGGIGPGGQPGGGSLFNQTHDQMMSTPRNAGVPTEGDIWQNPAFANAAAQPGGLFGAAPYVQHPGTHGGNPADAQARIAAALQSQQQLNGQIGGAGWMQAVNQLNGGVAPAPITAPVVQPQNTILRPPPTRLS